VVVLLLFIGCRVRPIGCWTPCSSHESRKAGKSS